MLSDWLRTCFVIILAPPILLFSLILSMKQSSFPAVFIPRGGCVIVLMQCFQFIRVNHVQSDEVCVSTTSGFSFETNQVSRLRFIETFSGEDFWAQNSITPS